MEVELLKEVGPEVRIFEPVTIISPEKVVLKGHDMISEYVHIMGGISTIIGWFVHIAPYVSISGGGRTRVEDFANIAAGSRIITGIDATDGTGLMGPTVPDRLRNVTRSFVTLKKFAFLATNTIVFPNITIGEGAVVGSGSVVTKDIEPWTINIGSPAKPIKKRPKDKILRLAEEAYKKL